MFTSTQQRCNGKKMNKLEIIIKVSKALRNQLHYFVVAYIIVVPVQRLLLLNGVKLEVVHTRKIKQNTCYNIIK